MTTQPRQILLVDDDPNLLSALIRLLRLERPEWTVAAAADGHEALAVLRAGPVDLVASDILMPGLDGLGLLQAMRGDPALASIPVVFITAKDDRASQREGMAAGADDYLAKPFQVEELIEAVEARLERRRQLAHRAGAAQALQARLRSLLSIRELEVLALIGHGLDTKAIALRLGLSPWTVRAHRVRLMNKLDRHSAPALAALAAQAQLAPAGRA